MALDGGTGSFRAILFDQDGNQLAVSQEEWTHLADPNIPGSMTFDCDHNWEIIQRCIKNLINENNVNAEDILAISSTTMREGFVLYDSTGKELIAFANVDGRAEKESAFLKKEYPALEVDLYEKTGESFALGALPRLLWIKNNRQDILDQVVQMNMLNDWIAYKLCGKIAVEPSNAGTTGLFNLTTLSWEFDSLDELGIKLEQTPVVNSGEILGSVSEKVAELTGLSTSTKVVMGGGDAQLGCLGVGSINDKQATLLGGSFWQLEYNSKEFIPDPSGQARINCHAIPQMFQYELISWMPGLTANWFVESFFDMELEQSTSKKEIYQLIESKLNDIPAGSYGIIATFSNVMNMLHLNNCSPTFTNFTLDPNTSNRYSFFKAIMESTAYTVNCHKQKVEELTQDTIEELIFAGGASANSIWCQIIADVLNVKVKVPVIKEATAFGAALLAGIGVGVYGSLEEAVSRVKIEKIYEPNPENHVKYKCFLTIWSQVYAQQLALADQDITHSMWKAPGI